MTARERMSKAYDKCAHPIGGVAGHICVDCVTAAILAHAQAVRQEDAQIADAHICGCGDHATEVGRKIRAREVE